MMPVYTSVIVSALVAFGYAAALYWRNTKDELDTWARLLVSALRFGFVFFIVLLFFSPVFKIQKEEVEKPLCVVAFDESYSMTGGDTVTQKRETERLIKKLEKDFRIESIGFAREAHSGIRGGFSEQGTDYEALFNAIKARAGNSENACVVLISDGNVNLGREPLYHYRSCAFPLFTLGLGDTACYPDLFIGQIQHNAYAYKGNTFPVKIQIGKSLVERGEAKLTLARQGKILKEQTVDFGRTGEVEWEIEAEEEGVFRYTVTIESLLQERNKANNRADFTVNILESRRKILILAQVPHPDISALEQSLRAVGKYDMEKRVGKKLSFDNMEKYDLVILHGLPSAAYNLSAEQNALAAKPQIYILTPQTDFQRLNRLNLGLRIHPKNNGWNEAQPGFNRSFSQFELKSDEIASYEKFPPIYTPFAQYEGGEDVVFYQQILQTPTQDPLIVLNSQTPQPVLFFTGQGIWRWRLFDYRTTGTTAAFDRLTDRLVQMVSSRKPKENLVIHAPQKLTSTDNLEVRAEVYNASFERVQNPEVQFMLREETKGEEYRFDFLPDGTLSAGVLPEGDYVYTAACQNGNELYTARGRISVQAFTGEDPLMSADIRLLRNLSLTYNGAFFYGGTSAQPVEQAWSDLYRTLRERKDLKPRIRGVEIYVSLLDKTLLLSIFLALLCLEYLLRKVFGNL